MRKLQLFALTVLVGCTTNYLEDGIVIKDGHGELYSHPYWDDSYQDDEYRRLVFISTNDIHGNISPITESFTSATTGKQITYKVGGSSVLARYFEIASQRYKNQVTFLDSGDFYRGSFLSDHLNGEPIVEIFNNLPYSYLGIGGNDLNLAPAQNKQDEQEHNENRLSQLQKNIASHKATFLSTNIFDIQKRNHIDWKNVKPYDIKEINGVKVGFLGLSSVATTQSTDPEVLKGLFFRDIGRTILKYSEIVRNEGAQVVVGVVHSGGLCAQEFIKKYNVSPYQINFNPKRPVCDQSHELFQALNRLEPGSVDLIIAGKTNSKIANFYNGIPIIQAFEGGQFLSRVELFYSPKLGKIDNKKTIIHQPTKLCHHFIKQTQDCYSGDPSMQYDELVPATFLGEIIYPDPNIEILVRNYEKQFEEISKEKIFAFKQELNFHLERPSKLGSMVAYAIKKSTGTNISFTNHSSIKRDVSSGDFTLQDAYEVLPEDHYLSVVKLTGKQLRTLVEIATSGHTPRLGQFSGLKVVVSKTIIEERDLNGDGKKQDWERNRVKSILLWNGDKIDDEKTYAVGTHSYLTQIGGDNYGFVFKNVQQNDVLEYHNKSFRGSFIELLKEFANDNTSYDKIINKERNWLVTI